ncbi:hypothetical protein GN956_G24648 [Arapaima gigas]
MDRQTGQGQEPRDLGGLVMSCFSHQLVFSVNVCAALPPATASLRSTQQIHIFSLVESAGGILSMLELPD